jgi:Papain family cysteine protease
MIRIYGASRDVHDVRDRMFLGKPPNVTIPPYVDLRPWAGPVKDQGSEGSCTGHAFSSAREWINRKYEKGSVVLSPQSLYVDELIAEGSFPSDEGAMPRTACKVLTSKGCCELSLWPYVPGQIVRPTDLQSANALKWKTGAYHRLSGLNDVLSCLGDPTPWPVTVAFQVYESFESQQVADTGIMPIPKPNEQCLGGHETLCLGYDQSKQLALIQNSWSDSWGQKGFFWMPFATISRPDTDLWVCHTGRPWAVRSSLSTQAA